jgi:hypothetical protein
MRRVLVFRLRGLAAPVWAGISDVVVFCVMKNEALEK